VLGIHLLSGPLTEFLPAARAHAISVSSRRPASSGVDMDILTALLQPSTSRGFRAAISSASLRASAMSFDKILQFYLIYFHCATTRLHTPAGA